MAADLRDAVEGVLRVDPAAPAVEFEQVWRTWADLDRLKRGIEDAIESVAGGADGTRVGVLLRNRPELIPAILATLASHACLVTINSSYPDTKLAEDIRELRAPVLIGCSRDWDRPAVAEAALSSKALCLEIMPDFTLRIRRTFHPDAANQLKISAPGIAVEMLTSGTTGVAKRVPFQKTNFEKAVMSAILFEAGRSGDDAPRLRSGVQILLAPLAHIGGLLAVMNTVVAGRKSCLLEKFGVDSFRDAVKRHRPKVVSTPPAALKMIFDADLPVSDFKSLSAWRTGTAPLDPDLADAFEAKYNIPVLQNYGATEFGGVAGWTLPDFQAHWSNKRGAVGRLNPGTDGRTVDPESGNPLAAGEPGVLELRGGQIGDGQSWVRTTDIAVVDTDRFLWIKGRADNVIVRGGFKIQPADVVRAIEAHPAVLEAAVVALPDLRLGEVPAAAYVAKKGVSVPAADEVTAFLRERLLPYQIPVIIKAVADLPRTDSMKVSQPQLREMLLAGR